MSYFDRLLADVAALSATQLFFIGGSMKSGTTWLQIMLDAHPAVACRGESHVATHLAQRFMECLEQHNALLAQKQATVFGELPAFFPRYTLDDLAYLTANALLLGLAKFAPGCKLLAVGEKTPDNVRYFDVLHAIFPNARFVHLVRDGRDCAVSGWFHNQRSNPEWTRQTHASLDDYVMNFAREWVRDLAEGSAFATAHPGHCLTLRYEDLVTDTAATLQRVFAFLGVAADAAVLDACCAAGAFRHLSGGRSPGQESRASFFRNGLPGDWRRHLDAAQARRFGQITEAWLDRFGYA